MKRTFLLSLLLLLTTMGAWAVPARRGTFTHTQKDGTILTLTLVGDEYQHYYLNTITHEKLRLDTDGDYYVIDEAEMETLRLAAKTRRAASNQRRMSRMRAQSPAKIGNMGTMTGQKKGIVILVNFKDKSMTTGTQAKFNNMFNQQGYNQDGHIGSVADYFKAQSYGQFELSFDVVGPVTLSNNMAYYGGNDSYGNDLRPGDMAREACVLANGLGVDFSKYDWDGDGFVDQVFVIFAGYGENYSGADENTIWPHEWDLVSAGSSVYSVDGVKVKTYACCAELYGTKGSTLNGMGTACHEFSHCLGYPDTYDTDYSGGVGMDSYDIMCSGSYNGPNGRGEVPAGFTAYERWMAGWLEPTELSSAANITNMKDLGTEGEAYVIYNNSNKNEYFLLENRQSKDWFRYYDSNIAGHGLFITHIDYSSTVWNNNAPNDDPNHQRMAWVPADKNYGTYSSSSKSWSISSTQQKGDYFPGTSNVKSFKPTASAWNTTGGKWFNSESGSYYTSHDLSEITENTTAGTISFLFDGGLVDDGSRYTITLNPCGGTVPSFPGGTVLGSTTTTWTQSSYKEALTLPEPETTVPGWEGAGWSTTRVTTVTNLDDLTDFIDYGKPYTPESDVTLYAVYMDDNFNCLSTPANFTVTLNAGAGSCTTTTWTQGDGNRSLTLPTPTIDSQEWTFAGWTTSSVAQTTTRPSTLLKAGDSYAPTDNVTLYAVYTKSEGGGTGGSYTLDYSSESGLQSKMTTSYGNAVNYTATDGSTWVVKAYKNNGMQINSGKDATIKVPECPGNITSIIVSFATDRILGFSTTDYSSFTQKATSTTSGSTATIDLSGKGLPTGYIYSTSGATVITKIVVNYGGSGTTYYATNPELVVLPTPTIAFAEPNASGKAMLVGDTYTNKATASCTGVTLPAVTYTSSRPEIATVDNTGKVTAIAAGTTTITATVAAVDGKSKAASVSYTITVSMPTLSSIAVTTEPTKKEYTEGETFDPTGMVVTATYSNGYTATVPAGYTISPTTALSTTDKEVTISYTENGVTKTAIVAITITPLPRYTVTFNAGTGTCATTSLTETVYQGGVTLPTCNDATDDWKFAGWATAAVGTATTTAPTLLKAGDTYKPNANCTLYAVYVMTEGEGEVWKKVAVSAVNSAGTYALITTDGHAFNGSISSGHGQVTSTAFSFDASGIATSAPEGTCELTFTSVSGGYTMYNAEKGYLYGKAAKAGNLDWHETENYHWSINGGSWIYSNNNVYLRVYSNTFRTYGAVTNENIAFAQKISSSTSTYHSRPSTEPVVPPTLTCITITTEPAKTEYTEGETFNPAGMVVTATYDNGHTAIIPQATTVPAGSPAGYTYSPTTALSITDTEVTISYTEGEVTKTATVSITVNALPLYTVTFNNCGHTTAITEESHQSGVTPPSLDAVTGYTFLGWVTSEQKEETTTSLTPVALSEGKYMPMANTTLYALYSRTEEGGGSTEYTLKYTDNGVPSAYNSSGATVSVDGINYILKNAATYNNKYIQIQKGASNAIYNNNAFSSAITSITVVYANNIRPTLYIGDSANSTTQTISGSANDNTLTYYCSSYSYTYFTLRGNANNAAGVESITITCGTPSTTYFTTSPSPVFTSQTLNLIAHTSDTYYATFSNTESVTFFPDDIDVSTVSVGPMTGILAVNALPTASATINGETVTGRFVPANTGVLIAKQSTSNLHKDSDPANITYYTVSNKVAVLGDPNAANMLLPGLYDSEAASPSDGNTASPSEGFTTSPEGTAPADYRFYKLAYNNFTEKTGLGFWYGADNGAPFQCKQGLAYLAVPKSLTGANSASGVKGYAISEDGTTAIAVPADDSQAAAHGRADDAIYDLNGRRVLRPGKGIYIIGGKKVVR